jgi:hypothetical protein
MKVDTAGEGFSKSIWGKLSWILGLAAILLFFFGLFAASAFNRALPGAILLYLVPILIAAGIFSGLMGFFTTRAWVGLVLNLLLAAIGCLLFLHIFSYCCAPPNLN